MSYDSYYEREPRYGMTPAVKWLLIANVLFFFAQQFRGELLYYWLALWPNEASGVARTPWGLFPFNQFYPWQLVSYAFLHGGWMHIAFNMLGLWMFGQSVEQALGTGRFLYYYLVCIVGAAALHLAVGVSADSIIPTVGASGGIFGLLLAFGLMFPHARVMMIFFPVPIEARYFVLIYGAMELINGVTNTSSNVAHFAHLGGMLFGFFLLQYWRGRFPFRGSAR